MKKCGFTKRIAVLLVAAILFVSIGCNPNISYAAAAGGEEKKTAQAVEKQSAEEPEASAEITKTPEVTAAAQEPGGPEATTSAAVTIEEPEEPEDSVEPEVTEEPEPTSAPVATPKPGVQTAAPAVTFGPPSAATSKNKVTLSPKMSPCKKKYRKKNVYNNLTKHYFLIRSYLEKFGAKGGGTITLKKGTYNIPCTLYIPSNITIKLKNGAKIVKTTQTGIASLPPTMVLFEAVSAAKAESVREIEDYWASSKVTISGSGEAVIDMNYAKGRTGFYIGHAKDVIVKGIKFKNRRGGNFIWVEGSRNVKISKCVFSGYKAKSGDKNKIAVRLENIHADLDTFPEKWGALTETPNIYTQLSGCTFYDQPVGIGTLGCVVSGTKEQPEIEHQIGIKIKNNKFYGCNKTAISARGWGAPVISGNEMKKGASEKTVQSYILGYGVTNPQISKNKMSTCVYPLKFTRSWAYGMGNEVIRVPSSIDSACIDMMKSNTIEDCTHYFVLNYKARILYYQDKSDNNFTVNVDSTPYREHYTNKSLYAKRKLYYVFKSYMEQLEYAGGGVLNIEPGTYAMPGNICVPSNVTINLRDGVTFIKEAATPENDFFKKAIFTILPPSKERATAQVKGYGGSKNVKIVGTGTVVMDCNNIVKAMAIVMGHANGVTIQGIKFLNEYGSHFIELNSSQDVTVEQCWFQNFKIYDEKSHKECINVDGTDENTGGFPFSWSSHDKTCSKNVVIRNNSFYNVGTAVGSHTYICSGGEQVYHENVQVLNNTVESTYNSPIRILNWKDCVVSGNTFTNTQSMNDGKVGVTGDPLLYPAIYVRGVINPSITDNTYDGVKYYPILIVLEAENLSAGAIKNGYPNTICNISSANYAAFAKSEYKNIEKEYQFIIAKEIESQSEDKATKIRIVMADADDTDDDAAGNENGGNSSTGGDGNSSSGGNNGGDGGSSDGSAGGDGSSATGGSIEGDSSAAGGSIEGDSSITVGAEVLA